MKTDWEKEFDERFCESRYAERLKQFISKELDKAREEGWQSGYRQGSEKDLK